MIKTLTILVALFLVIGVDAQNNPSTVKEYNKNFKTYAFSDPDPIARMGSIYPYYRFDGYTDTPINKEWKVVELENDFIKLMILPEIGGKIWGAWEKSSGKPFIYFNQVVKFRDVAMRGPWTSGGIEANYGIIGHTPNCATPVDYLVEKKDDGSVSCYIGTLDLLTQTYWTIEINLPKDKGYFTTRSFWHNSSSLEQPYYTWMNTGLKAAGNLEFIYPGNRYLGHNGEYGNWKINKESGKNVSFYEQNNFGGYKSYHVFGAYTDFFGAYWHNENFGMGRYATHDEKPGKKIWIWGLSQQGMIWDKLLTDTDGQYVEVQSGRLLNQTAEASTFTPFKHRGFAPSSTDEWTEYWFPVSGTKGFVQANPLGALNIRNERGFLKIDFSPLQEFTGEIKIKEGDLTVYARTVGLKTLKTFSDSVKFNGNADNLVVTLGGTAFKYSSNPRENELNRPVDSPANFDWNSVFGLYVQGKENIRERDYIHAEEKLKACLGKDPNYLPALADLSMLMYRNMEYKTSLEFSRKALSIDTYDPGANYYYGLANSKLGNTVDAKDGFDMATSSVEYRSAAFLELGKIYFKENNFSRSLSYAAKSLEVNTLNQEAHQLLSVAYRMTLEKEKAMGTLRTLNALNPLNHFNRFEAYRWDNSEATRKNFTALIRNEMPHETYLQLADWYYSLGLVKDAMDVLSLSPAHPEVFYWMAFMKDQSKEGDWKEWIEKANNLSPDLVFPFRSRSAEVLEWVIEHTPRWEPKYYLGLIYWSRNNITRAKELFLQCETPGFSPFYASLASITNDAKYIEYLKKASTINANQWRFGKLLINRHLDNKNYEQALIVAKQYHEWFPKDFRLSMLLAKTYLLNNQYKACSDLLAVTHILPYEGATEGRQLYREAWMMQAVNQFQSKKYSGALNSISTAREWPTNLGVGKPYDADIDTRVESYLEGLCYEKLKNPVQATKKWEEVISFTGKQEDVNTLVSSMALRKMNRTEEGEKLLKDWLQRDPENKLARWCMDKFHGNKGTGFPVGDENLRILSWLLP